MPLGEQPPDKTDVAGSSASRQLTDSLLLTPSSEKRLVGTDFDYEAVLSELQGDDPILDVLGIGIPDLVEYLARTHSLLTAWLDSDILCAGYVAWGDPVAREQDQVLSIIRIILNKIRFEILQDRTYRGIRVSLPPKEMSELLVEYSAEVRDRVSLIEEELIHGEKIISGEGQAKVDLLLQHLIPTASPQQRLFGEEPQWFQFDWRLESMPADLVLDSSDKFVLLQNLIKVTSTTLAARHPKYPTLFSTILKLVDAEVDIPFFEAAESEESGSSYLTALLRIRMQIRKTGVDIPVTEKCTAIMERVHSNPFLMERREGQEIAGFEFRVAIGREIARLMHFLKEEEEVRDLKMDPVHLKSKLLEQLESKDEYLYVVVNRILVNYSAVYNFKRDYDRDRASAIKALLGTNFKGLGHKDEQIDIDSLHIGFMPLALIVTFRSNQWIKMGFDGGQGGNVGQEESNRYPILAAGRCIYLQKGSLSLEHELQHILRGTIFTEGGDAKVLHDQHLMQMLLVDNVETENGMNLNALRQYLAYEAIDELLGYLEGTAADRRGLDSGYLMPSMSSVIKDNQWQLLYGTLTEYATTLKTDLREKVINSANALYPDLLFANWVFSSILNEIIQRHRAGVLQAPVQEVIYALSHDIDFSDLEEVAIWLGFSSLSDFFEYYSESHRILPVRFEEVKEKIDQRESTDYFNLSYYIELIPGFAREYSECLPDSPEDRYEILELLASQFAERYGCKSLGSQEAQYWLALVELLRKEFKSVPDELTSSLGKVNKNLFWRIRCYGVYLSEEYVDSARSEILDYLSSKRSDFSWVRSLNFTAAFTNSDQLDSFLGNVFFILEQRLEQESFFVLEFLWSFQHSVKLIRGIFPGSVVSVETGPEKYLTGFMEQHNIVESGEGAHYVIKK